VTVQASAAPTGNRPRETRAVGAMAPPTEGLERGK
jgi:hypothetical protein